MIRIQATKVNQLTTTTIAAAALALSQVITLPAFAKPDGKTVYMSCMGCHGDEGLSQNPEWPNLAGQKKVYLVNQLKSFQAGTRANALMEPMAKTLSEEDLDAVTTYLSEMKLSIQQP